MEIHLNGVDDVKAFLSLLSPAVIRSVEAQAAIDSAKLGLQALQALDPCAQAPSGIERTEEATVREGASATYAGTPLVVGGDFAVSTKTDPGAADTPPAVDSTGRPWDERIDSSNRGTNADGTWRARRGVAPEVRAAVLAELAELLEANSPNYDEPVATDYDTDDKLGAGAETEPVATERHPLPSDAGADTDGVDGALVAPGTEDLAALVEAVEAIAQDLEGGMMDTLNACKAFTASHGVATFNAVKNAVAPTENGQGTPVNLLTPAQRRTLQAAVQTYDAYFASGAQG